MPPPQPRTEPFVNLSTETQVLAVLLAVVFLGLIVELVRRQKLQERYTVIWFAAALGLLVVALVPGVLRWITDLAGIADTNSTLFAVMMLVAGLMLLNLTVVVSRQAEQITRLSQELAIRRAEDDAADEPD